MRANNRFVCAKAKQYFIIIIGDLDDFASVFN